MERQYDLVVVGTGVTSAVASRCREAGWAVAVVGALTTVVFAIETRERTLEEISQ